MSPMPQTWKVLEAALLHLPHVLSPPLKAKAATEKVSEKGTSGG